MYSQSFSILFEIYAPFKIYKITKFIKNIKNALCIVNFTNFSKIHSHKILLSLGLSHCFLTVLRNNIDFKDVNKWQKFYIISCIYC